MTYSRRSFVAALACSGVGVAFAADQGAAGAATGSDKPVFVIATVEIKPGKRAEFIEIFKANVPNVQGEDGYISYEPVIDTVSGIDAQAPQRENVMTVVEKWASLDALKAHLKAPHMDAYRTKVKDLVAGMTLHIMQPA